MTDFTDPDAVRAAFLQSETIVRPAVEPDGPTPKPTVKEPQARRLALHTFADWSKRPAPTWLIPDFIPERAVGSVVSAPGGCKSWLLATLAFAAADGVNWRETPIAAFSTVYVACENPGSHARRHAMLMRSGNFSGRGAFLAPDTIDLLNSAAFDELARAVQEAEAAAGLRCGLLIIDTLRDAWTGDEDSASDSARVMRPLKRLRDELGVSVLYAHHCGHAAERERGSSNWRANADFVWFLDKRGGTVTARCLKMRDGPDDLSFAFRLAETGTGDAYLEFLDAAAPVRKRRLSPQRQLALDALLAAIAEQGVPSPPSLHLPSGVRGVPCKVWRNELYARLGDIDPNAKRQGFRRALIDLQGAGAVQVRDEFAWLP